MSQKKALDNNGQREMKVPGGEHRNGRLSQIKNQSIEGEPYPAEYVNKEKGK
jgi:hypothetical protein